VTPWSDDLWVSRPTGSTLARINALAAQRQKGYQTLPKEFLVERLYEEEMREGVFPATGRTELDQVHSDGICQLGRHLTGRRWANGEGRPRASRRSWAGPEAGAISTLTCALGCPVDMVRAPSQVAACRAAPEGQAGCQAKTPAPASGTRSLWAENPAHDPCVLAHLAAARESVLLKKLEGGAEQEAARRITASGHLGDGLDEPSASVSDLLEAPAKAARAMPWPRCRLST